ncbi:MAG: DUF58 domain-containing protein, partial [bacterium]|nr:DUF58 domain-containing protein [bacterium]
RDSGVLPLLASLSHYTAQTESQRQEKSRMLSDALTRLRRVARPGSLIVLISDFYSMDKDCEQHLNRLRAHNDILAYHVCDFIELTPPKPQQYAISNGQQEILLDTGIESVNDAYAQYCQQRIETLKEQFKRLQIQYVQVTPETELASLVRQTFPRRTRG